jgi:hypothetical protein
MTFDDFRQSLAASEPPPDSLAISGDKTVTINRLNDVTTVTVRDRNTGKVTSETFFGDSPYGK